MPALRPHLVASLLCSLVATASAAPLLDHDWAPVPLPALAQGGLLARRGPPLPATSTTPTTPAAPAAGPNDAELAQLRLAADQALGAQRLERMHRYVDALAERAVADPRFAPRTVLDASQALVDEPGLARYAKADQVLYRHAELLGRAQRPADARAALLRLVRDYPTSALVPDAYLWFAERLFEAADLAAARTAYQRVLKLPAARLHLYTRYKLAWIDFNLGDPRAAMAGFEEVATKAAAPLRDAALRDLARVYEQAGAPERVVAYFERIDPPRALAHVRRIAEHYAEVGKHAEARAVYRELAAKERDPAQACLAAVGAAQASQALFAAADLDTDTAELARAVVTGGDECREAADALVGSIASAWHGEYRARRSDPRATLAMWRRGAVVASTGQRLAAIERNLAIAAWDTARHARTSTVDWIAAGEALQASGVPELADASLDAYDNALRVARAGATKLPKAELARLRAGLARHRGDRARRLLAEAR